MSDRLIGNRLADGLSVHAFLPSLKRERNNRSAEAVTLLPEAVPASEASAPLSSLQAQAGVGVASPRFSASLFAGPRFQGAIHNDYSVEIRGNVPINAYTVSQTLQSLLIRDMKKGTEDTSNLKFYLGAMYTNGYQQQDQTALADTMTLIDRPVDVVVKSATNADGMFTLMSATGKRFMYPGANLMLGALRGGVSYRKNKDFQVDRHLFNAYVRDLENLVMERTGVKNRSQVHLALLSDREYNALEALAYGKKGFVEGILMGFDQVITRKNLDAYYAAQNWDPIKDKATIDRFNKDYMNVYKLMEGYTTPLAKFSKATLPSKNGNLSAYESMADSFKKEDRDDHMDMRQEMGPEKEGQARVEGMPITLDLEQAIETDHGVFVKVNMPELPPKEMTFYVTGMRGVAKTTQLPLNAKALPIHKYQRMEVEHAPANPRGILDDDVIYFNDAFMDSTAEQIGDALVSLDEKKQKERKQRGVASSNIKILENSPGGSVWSGQELRSTIRSLKTPVDVIVTGMGASCGSWLLCSATGKRYSTPNARIMIHEAASSQPRDNGKSLNEAADGVNQATVNYVQIVAESTGRPFNEVWKDFKLDVWFNPLESLFYGKNGLIDGILVGPDKVITRPDVEQYLLKKLGSKAKVKQYVAQMFEKKREPQLNWQPDAHNEADPFENNLRVIGELSKTAQPLNALKGFEASMAQPLDEELAANGGATRTVSMMNVIPSILDLLMDDDDDGEGKRNKKSLPNSPLWRPERRKPEPPTAADWPMNALG